MSAQVIDIQLARPSLAAQLAIMSRDLVETGLGWRWRRQRILAMIRHPEAVVIAARLRDEVTGFAVMEFHQVHAHLNLLAVVPSYRRHGVAGSLLAWLEASARVAGIERIDLEVRANNQGAIDFYDQAGFSHGAIKKGYYDGREDALAMSWRLIPAAMAEQRP